MTLFLIGAALLLAVLVAILGWLMLGMIRDAIQSIKGRDREGILWLILVLVVIVGGALYLFGAFQLLATRPIA